MEKLKLSQHHNSNKDVSTHLISNGEIKQVISLYIPKNGRLNKHFTKTPATLICVSGKARFSDENGFNEVIESGDLIKIEPSVVHWVDGLADSQLLLVK